MTDIVAIRDRMGLTTRELANLLGVGYRTAHGWMTDRTIPEIARRFLVLIDQTASEHPIGYQFAVNAIRQKLEITNER